MDNERNQKIDQQDRKMVEEQDLSLYKRFGYPEIRELGLKSPRNHFSQRETLGEIYKINIQSLTTSEGIDLEGKKGLVLFTQNDLKKLSETVDAVEIVFLDGHQMLVNLHGFYDSRESYDPLDYDLPVTYDSFDKS